MFRIQCNMFETGEKYVVVLIFKVLQIMMLKLSWEKILSPKTYNSCGPIVNYV